MTVKVKVKVKGPVKFQAVHFPKLHTLTDEGDSPEHRCMNFWKGSNRKVPGHLRDPDHQVSWRLVQVTRTVPTMISSGCNSKAESRHECAR